MDAIILSGSHRQIARRLGHATKSLIKYDQNTALDSVLKGVLESASINSAVVIGPDESRPIVQAWEHNPKPVFWVINPGGYSMFQNLIHAYKHLLKVSGSSREREIFFACSDIPFITGDIVSDFINNHANSGLTAVVPIVSLSSCRDLEQRLGMKIPSVDDHLPLALDGELYHLGNLGLLQPEKISPFWLHSLCMSRDARETGSVMQALAHPKRIKLIYHLFSGFLRQNKSKDIRQFIKFTYQLLNWVAASHFYKTADENKARKYSSRVDSRFLFNEFFPSFGLDVNLIRYDRPEVFIDFDTTADVDFLSRHYAAMKKCFTDFSRQKNAA